jgi:UDP-glucose 4,6-dehydratase
MEYKPTSVLLTGGAGFIGSNVLNYLVQKYPDVIFVNYDILDYCADLENVNVNHCPNYNFIKGDICNIDMINYVLKEYNIDTILHFAAQTHVDNSFGNSFVFTNTNIYGTHVLLECCKNYGNIKRFIHVSTDEVYGEIHTNSVGISEDGILNPTNPYAATKCAAEFLVKSYGYSYNLPIIITRGNNVYGENQYPEKIIPKFIKLLLNNQKCTIQGDGCNLRMYIYIDDVVSAFDRILTHGVIGEIYNIGSHNEFSNYNIAKLLINKIKHTHNTNDWIEYIDDRKFNDARYAVNTDKLESLGWKQSTDINDGINKTIIWMSNNLHRWNI